MLSKIPELFSEDAVTTLRFMNKRSSGLCRIVNPKTDFLASVECFMQWIQEGEPEVASLIVVPSVQQVNDAMECLALLHMALKLLL